MAEAVKPPLSERPLADLSPGDRLRLCAVADALAAGLTFAVICREMGLYQTAQEPGDSLKKWLRNRRFAWQEALRSADLTRTLEQVARLHETLDAIIDPEEEGAEKPSPETRTRAIDVKLRDIRKGQEIAQRREAQRIEVNDVTAKDPFADLRGQGLEEAAQRADRTLRLVEGASGHA